MPACPFGSVYERPDFFKRIGGRDFYCHMLAVFHRIESYRRVGKPVRTYIYKVYFIAFAKLFP